VKEELEATLLGAETGPPWRPSAPSSRSSAADTESVLAAWEEGGVRTDETARELDERRAQYERASR